MENEMAAALILMAGVLGMVIAVVHGGAWRVEGRRPDNDAPPSAKRILHTIMF